MSECVSVCVCVCVCVCQFIRALCRRGKARLRERSREALPNSTVLGTSYIISVALAADLRLTEHKGSSTYVYIFSCIYIYRDM